MVKRTSPTHKVFIDESGTKEYAKNGQYGTANTRYFVMGALFISRSEVAALAQEMSELKSTTFGMTDIEIKSNWLRMPSERDQRYIGRFGLTEEQLDVFVERLYSAVIAADLVFCAVVVDKVHMKEDYRERAWYPPAIAYEILLQRAQQYFQEISVYASVTIDDMTGATPKRNQYKTNLKRQHKRLLKSGSTLRRGFTFENIVGKVRFLNSAKSNMLQVADLCAYNVYRQFVERGEQWEQARESIEVYDYLERMAPKFRQGPEGRVQGYGIVKFPLRQRVLWGLATQEKRSAP